MVIVATRFEELIHIYNILFVAQKFHSWMIYISRGFEMDYYYNYGFSFFRLFKECNAQSLDLITITSEPLHKVFFYPGTIYNHICFINFGRGSSA